MDPKTPNIFNAADAYAEEVVTEAAIEDWREEAEYRFRKAERDVEKEEIKQHER